MPPKPKLFESAYSMAIARAVWRHIIQIAAGRGIVEINGGRRNLIT